MLVLEALLAIGDPCLGRCHAGLVRRGLRRVAIFLGEMLEAWRAERDQAPPLRDIRAGAWQHLIAVDQTFRRAVGASSSISGRGSPLSNAFNRARQAHPELAPLALWFSPIDFLIHSDLEQFGYRCEATRFAPGGGPKSAEVACEEATEIAAAIANKLAEVRESAWRVDICSLGQVDS